MNNKFVLVLLITFFNLNAHSQMVKIDQVDHHDFLGELSPLHEFSFGTDSSGGGAAIICKDGNAIKSVEMLDTYEGRILFGRKYSAPNKLGYHTLIDHYIDKLRYNKGFQTDLKNIIAHLKTVSKFLPTGVVIHTPSDLGNSYGVLVPTMCDIRAVGYYETDGTLLIATDYFNKMSEFQKAAFYLHEALYLLYRNHYRDSDGKLLYDYDASKTRKFLSLLLDKNSNNIQLSKAESNFRWYKGKNWWFADPYLFEGDKFVLKISFLHSFQDDIDYSNLWPWMQIACVDERFNAGSSNLSNYSVMDFDPEPGYQYKLEILSGCRAIYIEMLGWMSHDNIKFHLVDESGAETKIARTMFYEAIPHPRKVLVPLYNIN